MRGVQPRSRAQTTAKECRAGVCVRSRQKEKQTTFSAQGEMGVPHLCVRLVVAKGKQAAEIAAWLWCAECEPRPCRTTRFRRERREVRTRVVPAPVQTRTRTRADRIQHRPKSGVGIFFLVVSLYQDREYRLERPASNGCSQCRAQLYRMHSHRRTRTARGRRSCRRLRRGRQRCALSARQGRICSDVD